MPSKSKAQQQAAGIAAAYKKGDIPKSKLRGASKQMADMSGKDLKKFAKTKSKDLPQHVENRAHHIVKVLLDAESTDDTRSFYRVCPKCDEERGIKRPAEDRHMVSHGICSRHAKEAYGEYYDHMAKQGPFVPDYREQAQAPKVESRANRILSTLLENELKPYPVCTQCEKEKGGIKVPEGCQRMDSICRKHLHAAKGRWAGETEAAKLADQGHLADPEWKTEFITKPKGAFYPSSGGSSSI